MSDTRPFAVYGFASTHDALAAENVLKGADVSVVPIPSPKEIGELCGIALRVPIDDSARTESLLASARLQWSARVETEDL